jgi:hypothetical protein
MSKKMMVLALAVVSAALFALPAVASAQSSHISATTAFTVAGPGGNLSSVSGTTVNCTSTGGTGSFSTTTAGTVSLTFHGCFLVGLGVACTQPGQPSGTITVKNSFDLIQLTTSKAGVLLTPHVSNPVTIGKTLLTEFVCFGVSTKVYGNGVIGTIEEACGTTASVFKAQFEKSAHGIQKHQVWTGTSYDLIQSGASDPTAAIEGTAELKLAASRTLTCTHVA